MRWYREPAGLLRVPFRNRHHHRQQAPFGIVKTPENMGKIKKMVVIGYEEEAGA
jgi:hypothetical protein